MSESLLYSLLLAKIKEAIHGRRRPHACSEYSCLLRGGGRTAWPWFVGGGGGGGVVKRPGIKNRQGRTQRGGRGSLGLVFRRGSNGWRSSLLGVQAGRCLLGTVWRGKYRATPICRPHGTYSGKIPYKEKKDGGGPGTGKPTSAPEFFKILGSPGNDSKESIPGLLIDF
jgi:hypothetical protein